MRLMQDKTILRLRMNEYSCDWRAPPSSFSISEQEAHIWLVNLDLPAGLVQRLYLYLSPDEREQAQRFQFEYLRKRYIAGRGSLRVILGGYLHMPPGELSISYEAFGKPRFDPKKGGSWLSFNFTHSHELALLAVIRRLAIGIDLEYERELADADEIAARYFSREEVCIYHQLPPQEKQAAFYRCWTRKEAFIKAIGEGLSYPLDRFNVSVTSTDAAKLIQIGGSQEAGLEWNIFDIKPGPNYTAALAVECPQYQQRSGFNLVFWQCTQDLLDGGQIS